MMTKFVLKRPVTSLLIILSVIYFGLMSLNMFKFELTPDVSYPMYVVYTIYPGAAPKDVEDLVTKKIEDEVYNLQGAKDVSSNSRENLSLVVIQYDYDQNMDVAYNDLKKAIDTVKADFSDSVEEPMIVEMDINSMPTLRMAVRNKETTDIYNYVQNTFVKEIEKVSDVSSVDTSGGRENYIKIELSPEAMARYNLSMSTLASIIKVADFTYPAGTITAGKRDLSFSASVQYDTIESLKSIPIITGNKRTLYLEDIANIYEAKADQEDVGRYDSDDCIVVSVTKVQSASSIDVSKEVLEVVDELKAENPNLEVEIVTDDADNINASIENVFQTMIIAIILSMLTIFIFLGDLKGSIIIGTSIPFSILTALCCMYVSGYSLNLITLSALVLGVGMMVDNSIVMLEGCFRAKDNHKDENLKSYVKAVFEASETLGASIWGSTLTTVVVFAPLGFLSGLAGQFFKPLGFTIVYSMLASYISALTIVPLTYVALKPKEKKESLADRFVKKLQDNYKIIVGKFLDHKYIVALLSIVVLLVGLATIFSFKTELVAETDEGMIQVSITTKPGLKVEEEDTIYKYFENYVKEQPETDHYLLSNSTGSISMSSVGSSSGQSLIVFLKDDRKKKTAELVTAWKKDLTRVPDCTVNVSNYSTSFTSSFTMTDQSQYEVLLESSDYDKLKEVNTEIVKKLEQRKDISNITTYMDNDAPVVKLYIDPILAAAEGFTPAQVGQLLNYTVSGVELYDMTIDDETLTVKLEYDKDEYNSVDKIENIQLTSAAGNKATIKDIGTVVMEDSPAAVHKYNKKYRTQITADFNQNMTASSEKEITETIINPYLSSSVKIAKSQVDKLIDEEFGSLYVVIGVSIFLVFVVMASQFESVRYSLMVMGTILFSFMGGLVGLWLMNLKLGMVSLLGFLMLTGTAVNNGILYVDTVNQKLEAGDDLRTALIESGALRLRPILMTTITTLVSMIPMSLAYGRNGEILQGLGVADFGGLLVSTIMALFLLPIYYSIFTSGRGDRLQNLERTTKEVLKEEKN